MTQHAETIRRVLHHALKVQESELDAAKRAQDERGRLHAEAARRVHELERLVTSIRDALQDTPWLTNAGATRTTPPSPKTSSSLAFECPTYQASEAASPISSSPATASADSSR